jgi:hypothetical protein
MYIIIACIEISHVTYRIYCMKRRKERTGQNRQETNRQCVVWHLQLESNVYCIVCSPMSSNQIIHHWMPRVAWDGVSTAKRFMSQTCKCRKTEIMKRKSEKNYYQTRKGEKETGLQYCVRASCV